MVFTSFEKEEKKTTTAASNLASAHARNRLWAYTRQKNTTIASTAADLIRFISSTSSLAIFYTIFFFLSQLVTTIEFVARD